MAKIAVIGAGTAGMGCAHFLHRHHNLTVFEASGHIGGEAGAPAGTGDDRETPADTAFMVCHEETSPLLARLFAQLQVPVKKTALTFSVRDDTAGLEWSGSSLNHLFAQRKNLLNPRFLRLLAAVGRFRKDALPALDDPDTAGITLGEHVRRRGYGEDLFNLHLAPLGAALWGSPPGPLLSAPAAAFLRLLHTRGLLGRPAPRAWLIPDGGARDCARRLIAPWRGLIQIERPVARVIRNPRNAGGGVTVMTADGATHLFDKVVLATRADHALRLLVNPTPDEARLLGEFKYHASPVTLHTDASVLPRRPLARAVCNHHLSPGPDGHPAPATHFWMNALQDAPDGEPRIVSVGRPDLVDPARVILRLERARPLFTLGTLRAQIELPRLNEQARGRTETYFAGSYFRHGFHEDALQSAAQLGELLLERDPWTA